MTPSTLRGALRAIEKMLTKQPYSESLWSILTCLRGPDSRNRKLKFATTTVIRSAAFPSRPCETLSYFGTDTSKKAVRRKKMFKNKEDLNHFRQHVEAAFDSLGLKLFEENYGTGNHESVGRRR
jgi:hypothetical protein